MFGSFLYFVFVHILCYDLWFYITHIILHHPNVYFIHKIHHKKKYSQLTYIDTNEAHYIEHIMQPLGIFIPCFISKTHFIYLFVSFSIVGTRALMRHDERCSWLIGNHHLIHHKYPHYNYGEYWIDYLCGTLYRFEMFGGLKSKNSL
jgi:lathosterol oxidase